MTLTSIEIIAAVTAIWVLIKTILLLTNRNKLSSITNTIYDNQENWTIVFSILSLIILFYLLKELTIVQIFATIAFASLLFAISLFQYPEAIKKMHRKIINQKLPKSIVMLILFWTILSLWVLSKIFIY